MTKKNTFQLVAFFTISIICVISYLAFGSYTPRTNSAAFAFLTNPTVTTIDTAGVYQKLLGVFNNKYSIDFELAADTTLQYIGKKDSEFSIMINPSCSANLNGTTVNYAVKINGVIDSSSINGTYLKISNESQALTVLTVVSLAQNDKVEIVITSDGANDQITTIYLQTKIEKFGSD